MRGVLVTAACAGCAWLAGCGGGGGGDGGSPASSNPVVYVGNSSAAVITATNAGAIAANLTGNGSAVSSGLSVAGNAQFPDAGQAEVGRRISRGVRRGVALPRNEGGRLAMAIPVDETQPCDSGSTRVSGTLADDGTGTLAVTFNACRTGDDTLSGTATMRVDAINGDTITDYTLGIPRITVRGPGLSADVGGSLRSHLNLATNTETITENAVVLDNLTGRMTKSEDLVLVDVYNSIFSPSSYLETVTGRIYDSVHGFVDIATLVQLSFGTLAQDFPDSGVVELTGASGARIRATAASSSLVRLALDLDGNTVFEIAATLNWTDLSGTAGADLADTDGDGMHNSWELAKSLNPNDPADAALDPDNDGAGNLSEYLAGTNPNSNASVPPTAGLSIGASDSPDPTTVGSNVTYVLTVVNSGSGPATNVVVTDTLPAGVNLISATASQGACLGSAPVVCSLGTVAPSLAVTVTIVISPTAQGTYVNTAAVNSSALDPNTSDNTATSTTTVGQAAAGIQGMIDATPDGGTVEILPGIYFGNLDLRNRNIVLQSRDGPSVTTLHGNNGTAIRMGPDSSVRGFTITGGFATFGGGIDVVGTGSVIAGNVFDSNIQSSGGGGAAIWGNNASPTIERNVFRHHVSCSGGVVAFVNVSSPLIRNNVFHNNTCAALHFVTPIGNTPQIINNTFVGNNIAIYLDRRVPHTTEVYRNNLVAFNQIGWHVEVLQETTDADNPVWQNNLVFGNTVNNYRGTADQTGVDGNVSADPLYIDGASANYRLQALSPAINAGSPIGAPAVDFDGTARPQGAGFDIGAFERTP